MSHTQTRGVSCDDEDQETEGETRVTRKEEVAIIADATQCDIY